MSQEDLAHEAGLHRSYIGQVESGRRNMALDNLVRLARALGLSLGELLDGLEGLRGRNR
jgi:transcriptional regulator with XRE-family HTH domain